MAHERSPDGYRAQFIPRREGSATKPVELGSRAGAHVTEIARDWGGALGAEVLARNPATERIWTYLAPNEEPPPLDDHLGDSLMDLRDVVDTLVSHLADDPESAVVIRHALAEPDDPWLQKVETPRFSFEREVYFYLRGNQERERVSALLNETSGIWRFGVLTRLAQPLAGAIGRAELSGLAHDARVALVSAWSGDGDLLWELARSRS